MLVRPSPILSNVRFIEDDFKSEKGDVKVSRGFLFMCNFGAGRLLMGCHGKLWRVYWKKHHAYKKDWPWVCNPSRLKVETLWCPLTHHNNPLPYSPECFMFEKRGRYYRSIHHGRLENLNHLLIRLQRWTRRMLKRSKRLALCMAFHPRLGVESGLAELGQDILSLIAAL